jgi:hypothetical protein
MRILIVLIALFILSPVLGQKRYMDMDIKAGIGAPELLHTGLRFNISRAHYDFFIGGWPDERQLSVGLNYAHHFGKKWKEHLSKQPPWYISWGASYLYWNRDDFIQQDVYATTRLGRDFNLMPSLSLSLSLGLSFTVYHQREMLVTETIKGPVRYPFYPSGQFTLVYTFLKDISDKKD